MKRLENESFIDYKKRRKLFQVNNKRILQRGLLVWNSFKQGTFVRQIKKS